MKLIKNSFLFFHIIVILFTPKDSYAQQAIDSLGHYYNLFVKAKGNNDLKKAYLFFNQQKEVHNQKKDTTSLIFDLRILASIEYKFGNLHKSDATAVTALELIEATKTASNTIEAKIGVLNHLGIVSYELKNYDRALNLYNRALKIAQTKKQKNTIYNNN